MEKAAIIVMGKPGSGKGTQAKLLADKFGFFHLITGKVGKEYALTHSDPETKKQIEKSNRGFLWESSWVLKVVKERTNEIFSKVNGIVYDGTVRTLYEAEQFLPFFIKLFGKDGVKILNIEARDEEIIGRIEKRLTCSVNRAHVFIESEKLLPGMPCPENDGVLEERVDDNKESIKIRLEEYHTQTEPAVDFLKNNHKVIIINGEQSIENVHKDILKTL